MQGIRLLSGSKAKNIKKVQIFNQAEKLLNSELKIVRSSPPKFKNGKKWVQNRDHTPIVETDLRHCFTRNSVSKLCHGSLSLAH